MNGKEILLEGDDPAITDATRGQLHINWPLKSVKGALVIDMNEQEMKIRLEGNNLLPWYLDMTAAAKADLPFKNVSDHQIGCLFDGMKYTVTATQGTFSTPEGAVFRISPQAGTIVLNLATQ